MSQPAVLFQQMSLGRGSALSRPQISLGLMRVQQVTPGAHLFYAGLGDEARRQVCLHHTPSPPGAMARMQTKQTFREGGFEGRVLARDQKTPSQIPDWPRGTRETWARHLRSPRLGFPMGQIRGSEEMKSRLAPVLPCSCHFQTLREHCTHSLRGHIQGGLVSQFLKAAWLVH